MEVGHVLRTSPTMTLTQYDAGAARLWVGLSLTTVRSSWLSPASSQGMRPRFTQTYSQARSLHLGRFRPSIKQRQDFQAQVEANWVRLKGVPGSWAQSDARLRHLTNISSMPLPQERNGRYGISIKCTGVLVRTYAALQAQLVLCVVSVMMT